MKFNELSQFRDRVRVLPMAQARLVRARFQEALLDTGHPNYDDRILRLRPFSDGEFCTGYMWDYLRNPRQVSEEEVLRMVAMVIGSVYAMWDVHSSDRIRIPDYWKFSRSAVLAMRPADLLAGLGFLPEDLYMFDGSYSWACILTHEYDEVGKRWCLVAPADHDPSSSEKIATGHVPTIPSSWEGGQVK